jgi:hypothetical protein
VLRRGVLPALAAGLPDAQVSLVVHL